MFALHVLKQRERLAERAQRVLHAGLAVRLGGGVFRLEEGPDGFGDVLRHSAHLLGDVRVFLQCLERFAKRFTSLSRFAGR